MSMNDLGPGWIAFGPIGGAAGGLVAAGQMVVAPWKHQLTWKTWWKIRHTGVVVDAADPERGGGPVLVQAEPGGVEAIEMTAETHWTSDWAYILPRYRDTGQAQRVADAAVRQARKRIPYSFECYPAILAHRTHLPIPLLDDWLRRTDTDGDPVRVICSWEVDSALTLAGGLTKSGNVFDDGRVPHDVVPSELYLRLLELRPARIVRPGAFDIEAPDIRHLARDGEPAGWSDAKILL